MSQPHSERPVYDAEGGYLFSGYKKLPYRLSVEDDRPAAAIIREAELDLIAALRMKHRLEG